MVSLQAYSDPHESCPPHSPPRIAESIPEQPGLDPPPLTTMDELQRQNRHSMITKTDHSSHYHIPLCFSPSSPRNRHLPNLPQTPCLSIHCPSLVKTVLRRPPKQRRLSENALRNTGVNLNKKTQESTCLKEHRSQPVLKDTGVNLSKNHGSQPVKTNTGVNLYKNHGCVARPPQKRLLQTHHKPHASPHPLHQHRHLLTLPQTPHLHETSHLSSIMGSALAGTQKEKFVRECIVRYRSQPV